jgi:hypothetical protein
LIDQAKHALHDEPPGFLPDHRPLDSGLPTAFGNGFGKEHNGANDFVVVLNGVNELEFSPTASFNSFSNVLVLKGVVNSRSWLTSDTLQWSWDPRPPSPQVLELSVVKLRLRIVFYYINYFRSRKYFHPAPHPSS